MSAVVLCPAFARADEDNPRELGGHVYAPSELVRHPFTGTYADGLGNIIEPTTSANSAFLPANSCTANA